MARSSDINFTFSAVVDYTLTGSYVASDAVVCDYTEMSKIYAYYTSATNNAVLNFQVEVSPYSAAEDTANVYWFPLGAWVDGSGNQQTNATGSWVAQPATYNSPASVTASAQELPPLPLNITTAKRVRILAKETGGTTAGTVRFIFQKNDY